MALKAKEAVPQKSGNGLKLKLPSPPLKLLIKPCVPKGWVSILKLIWSVRSLQVSIPTTSAPSSVQEKDHSDTTGGLLKVLITPLQLPIPTSFSTLSENALLSQPFIDAIYVSVPVIDTGLSMTDPVAKA